MYSRTIAIAAAIAALLTAGKAAAQQAYTLENGAVISNVAVDRGSKGIDISMDMDLRSLKVGSNRTVSIVPAIAGDSDTLALRAVTVCGRQSRLYSIRNGRPLSRNSGDIVWAKGKKPRTYRYTATVPYSSWMGGAQLTVNECTLGCCDKVLADNWDDMGRKYTLPSVPEYTPEFVFVRPKASVHKMRSLEATSYVDFPVSQTGIYPKYRNNPQELARIVATIDSVKNDRDVTIKRITLKGFASPESPYSNNTRLAEGRTESVEHYVAALSHIPDSVFVTDFEPENWEGLRAYVEKSDFSTRAALLSIINDNSLEPDAREWKLKSSYPEEYAYLLEHCYPALRKVDYRIDYEVRSFKGVEDIRAAYERHPQNLSLEEFFVLAQSYDENSRECHEIFRQAVKYYPEDRTANLNAALVAMSEGRLSDAGRHLDKAGDSDEAVYARGVLSALQGNWNRAADSFERVKGSIPEAAKAAQTVDNIIALSEFLK